MQSREERFEGSCLCQRVLDKVSGPLGPMENCYCTDCRKAHAAAFGTFIDVPKAKFSYVRGETNLEQYEADNGAIRSFCRTCGSLLTWERNPEWVTITVATLDTLPMGRKPEHHIFVRSKVPWYEIQDGCPQYETIKPQV